MTAKAIKIFFLNVNRCNYAQAPWSGRLKQDAFVPASGMDPQGIMEKTSKIKTLDTERSKNIDTVYPKKINL